MFSYGPVCIYKFTQLAHKFIICFISTMIIVIPTRTGYYDEYTTTPEHLSPSLVYRGGFYE